MSLKIERLPFDFQGCFHRDRRLGFEFKYSERPSATKSMQVAFADLGLDHLYVVYPGKHRIPLAESITASPLPELLHALSQVNGHDG